MTPPNQPSPAADRTILDWPTLQRVFDQALQLPPADRSLRLPDLCGDDPGLRRQVESLLVALGQFDAVLSPEHIQAEAASLLEPEIPTQIGPYRVLSLIGRGGMGAVYLAERADSEFRLQVAVKVSRNPLFDQDARLRFRAERQILANLNHPNIARLLDGGTTPSG